MKSIPKWIGLVSLLGCCLVTGVSQGIAQEESENNVKPGEQVARSLEIKVGDRPTTVRFWLFIPKQYDSSKPMPLMLFLHGAGERGDDLEMVKRWGPPKLVKDRPDFPFIVISPQCPAKQWWRTDEILPLIEHIVDELEVDTSRIYVTGLSMGGFGTWSLLAEKPDLFAAAVPICGGGDVKKVDRFKHVPIWVFHGDKDEVVPPEKSRELVEALRECGAPVKYTEYEGVDHNSWSATYANEELYKWMLEQKRSK